MCMYVIAFKLGLCSKITHVFSSFCEILLFWFRQNSLHQPFIFGCLVTRKQKSSMLLIGIRKSKAKLILILILTKAQYGTLFITLTDLDTTNVYKGECPDTKVQPGVPYLTCGPEPGRSARQFWHKIMSSGQAILSNVQVWFTGWAK